MLLEKGLYLSLDHVIKEVSTSAARSTSNGIVRKIINQILVLEKNGFEMEVLCPYAGRNHFLHAIGRRLPFFWLRKYGKEQIKKSRDYSFIYVRKQWFLDGDTILFLRSMKKANKSLKILLEVPTYPVGVGEINHFHMIPMLIKDSIAIKHLHNYVDRVVTFSDDSFIFNIPTIRTCNAIDPKTIQPIKGTDKNQLNGKIINLIACSSMAFWHGYDRIIEGLRGYYSSGASDYKVLVHFVGDGEQLVSLKRMVEKYNLHDYVFFYGYLEADESDKIYEIADIALDSMGRHRSKVFYNSSLKGKEYCAKGLPVISGVETELDHYPSYPYYLRVPADDSPICIQDVISFYNKIYKGNQQRKDIIKRISGFAAEHFSFDSAFKPIIEYLCE